MTITAQETATQERVAADALEVIPTSAALGATVNGVNLRDLSEATFARILQAWHQHSVLLFRGQTLTDQDLIAFSRRLGDLDWAPVQETGRRFVEGLPEIYIVSNVKVNGEPIGSLGDGEAVWHTDMSYLDLPPKASMLYLGRRRNAYLAGLELAESDALLNELWSIVDRREFSWEHVWRVGDLVLWDNRCTMHRRDAFDPDSRRIMHRTQVKGDARPA